MSLYGTVGLKRALCPACGGSALVLASETACCGVALVTAPDGELPTRRECVAVAPLSLSARLRRRLLLDQDHRCFYCARRFGRVVQNRAGLHIPLRIEYDHRMPRCFQEDHAEQNMVAACHLCNRLKGGDIFASLDEARWALSQRWITRGYADLSRV